jgi:3-methyladenine DNA glycosylase AlkD
MNIVDKIQADISKVEGRKTKLFRDIAKSYKKDISSLDIGIVYDICDTLLKTRNRAETLVAYQIIFDQKKRYTKDTFDVFEEWVYKYIRDWWDCDDFTTHALQYELMKYPEYLSRVKDWIKHEAFAVRRSAAVVLIVPAKKGWLQEHIIFDVCDLLIDDPHYLVQKGYGWLLKVASKEYHDSVIKYLEKNVTKMSRTAFRYALEKLSKEEKERLMEL